MIFLNEKLKINLSVDLSLFILLYNANFMKKLKFNYFFKKLKIIH